MDITAKVNQALRTIFVNSPELAKLFTTTDNPAMTFPEGLRYRFWRVRVGRREWKYCYSTTKNKNGRFVSWVYKPHGITQWSVTRLTEFRRRNTAKRNAQHRVVAHQARLDKQPKEAKI